MSRHVEMLRRAGLEAELFAPKLAARPAPVRARDWAESALPPAGSGNSRDQWQLLAQQLFLGSGRRLRASIGLASATAGEGTSYVALHLAAELARSGSEPVLLLEANVHRPALAERFAVEPDPGLLELLRAPDCPPEDCLRQTGVERLFLLPAGTNGNGGKAAPDWGGLRRLYPLLRERFAAIVVDLAPINFSSDFLILGPLLDGLALVVEADLCSREVIQNAVARLRRASPSVVGAILNKRKFVIPAPIYRRL
mgnify:CR=1 FL=1|jgi:Mrp family chromosome partitioning ATPase